MAYFGHFMAYVASLCNISIFFSKSLFEEQVLSKFLGSCSFFYHLLADLRQNFVGREILIWQNHLVPTKIGMCLVKDENGKIFVNKNDIFTPTPCVWRAKNGLKMAYILPFGGG